MNFPTDHLVATYLCQCKQDPSRIPCHRCQLPLDYDDEIQIKDSVSERSKAKQGHYLPRRLARRNGQQEDDA